MAYHHAECVHLITAGAYHQPTAAFRFLNDDIQTFDLMIYDPFQIDDMQDFALIASRKRVPFAAPKKGLEPTEQEITEWCRNGE